VRRWPAAAAALLLMAGAAPALAEEDEGALAEPPRVAEPAPQREVARGLASWYGPRFHGRRTASGERFDQHQLTAAHRTLPFGTIVRVRSLVNGRTVDVRINDRGPHIRRRVIDLSRAGTKPVVISVPQQP
jgi:rare lipoprotein A